MNIVPQTRRALNAALATLGAIEVKKGSLLPYFVAEGRPNPTSAELAMFKGSAHGYYDLSKFAAMNGSNIVGNPMLSASASSDPVIDADSLYAQHVERVETCEALISTLIDQKKASDSLFMLITGSAGFGKTHAVREALETLSDSHTIRYVTGKLTDSGLFDTLQAGSEVDQITVFDDVELSFSKECLNYLKGAMQTKSALRFVTKQTADGETTFLFHGSLVWIANEKLDNLRKSSKSESIRAVASRFPFVIDLDVQNHLRRPLTVKAIHNGLLNNMGLNLGIETSEAETIQDLILEIVDKTDETKVNFRFVENLLRTAKRFLKFDEKGLITESLDRFERIMRANQTID